MSTENLYFEDFFSHNNTLNETIFQDLPDSSNCNNDNGSSNETADVSNVINHSQETPPLSTSIHPNKTTNEFVDEIFEDSSNWKTVSIFNEPIIDNIGSRSQYRSLLHKTEAEKSPQNNKTQQDNKNNVNEDDFLSSPEINTLRIESFSDDIKLDNVNLGFEDHVDFNDTSIDKSILKPPNCEEKSRWKDEKIVKEDSFYGLSQKVKALIFNVKKIDALYDWQDECLRLRSLTNRKNLIYALPTSGGKTLVAEILMLREITCNRKNAIFILPFVAIVQEKTQSMAPFAIELDFLVEEYAGSKGVYPPMKRRRKNSLYICTIEKSLGLLNSLIETNRLKEISMIVVDELHLLGDSGGRGATLEGLLTKLMYIDAGIQIIGMSATIGNLNEVAEFLKADIYTRNFRPVELKEYVKCGEKIWLIDPKEEDIFTDEKKVSYRYSEKALKLDPDKIGGLVMDVVPKDSCLIFCASRQNCENVALLLTRVLFKSLTEHKTDEKKKLLVALKSEGELCPILSQTIAYGVAYHHSGLTTEERKLIEDAYREGILSVICCTSTLAAGVNLPARRVILRSPYVGADFLNLSRYKQMIGRAGRAGMGQFGESILLCKSSEIAKVRTMLTSSMDDCVSTFHIEQDRGQNNLIMSSIMLSLAENRSDLHKIVNSSLLAIQAERLGVVAKDVVDRAVVSLIKTHSIRIKNVKVLKTHCDTNYVMESQIIDEKHEPEVKKVKQSVVLRKSSLLELSPLGKAAMKGSLDLQTAYYLYEDLKIAQNHLILTDDFHLLYLVAPYDIAKQIKPVGSVVYDVLTSLPSSAMKVPILLGLNEAVIFKLREGIVPKHVNSRVLQRFYISLMMCELRNGQTVYAVAEKYRVTRGITQNLLIAAASFTSSIVRFCQEIPELWVFTDFMKSFGKTLTRCCNEELDALMELPAVKMGRAKQLYNAGFKSLQSIARADPKELQKNLKFVSRKTVTQMITSANLLLMEKVENLKDEYAELMEGLQANQIL